MIVGLVDLSYITVRQYKARAKESAPNDAVEGVMSELARFRSRVDRVVLCLDAPPYWRSEIYPEYKGTRPPPDQELIWIKRRVYERITQDGYAQAKAQGYEADDVIGCLAKRYEASGYEVRILSSDKDCAQCVTDKVKLVLPGRGGGLVEVGPKEVQAKFGVAPKDMALFLALVGDDGDNIPGVDGWGQKTASEHINDADVQGSLPNLNLLVVNSINELAGKAPKVHQKYAAVMPDIELWLKLTTLHPGVPITASAARVLLEHKAQLPLVEEQREPGADEEEAPDWDAVAEETERRELGEMNSRVDEVISRPKGAPPVERNERSATASAGTNPKANGDGSQSGAKTQQTVSGSPVASASSAGPVATAGAPSHGSYESSTHVAASATPVAPSTNGAAAPSVDPKSATPVANGREASTYGDAARAGTASDSVAHGAAAPTVEVLPKPRQSDEITSLALTERPVAPSWALQLQPATAREAMDIAKTLFNSRYFMQFGSERGCFAIIMYGRELGLGIMQSLSGFFDVQGKPFASAALLRGLVQSSPWCEYFICTHSEDKSATWITRRRGWPQGREVTYTYTWEEAELSGITSGGNRKNWETKPRSMLEKTASSRLARQVYADVVGGLHSVEESE